MAKNDTPGPGSYMPPSDFGYLELYKYSPRTSHGQRSMMEGSIYKTESKFNRGISQHSTRANTIQKSRNNQIRLNSMMENYSQIDQDNSQRNDKSKSEVRIDQMNQTISWSLKAPSIISNC